MCGFLRCKRQYLLFLQNFLIQTGKHDVYHVPDAGLPQHVPLLSGVRNVRHHARLVLPRGRTLEKHLNNYDRKCVWNKVKISR